MEKRLIKKSICAIVVIAFLATMLPIVYGTLTTDENTVHSDIEDSVLADTDDNIVESDIENEDTENLLDEEKDIDNNIVENEDTENLLDEEKDIDNNIVENEDTENLLDEEDVEDNIVTNTDNDEKSDADDVLQEEQPNMEGDEVSGDMQFPTDEQPPILDNAIDGLLEDLPLQELEIMPLSEDPIIDLETQAIIDNIIAKNNVTITTNIVVPASVYTNNQFELSADGQVITIEESGTLSFEHVDNLEILVNGELLNSGILRLIENQKIIVNNADDVDDLLGGKIGAYIYNEGLIELYDTSLIDIHSGEVVLADSFFSNKVNVQGINRTGTGELIYLRNFTDGTFAEIELSAKIQSDIGDGQYLIIVDPEILYKVGIWTPDNSIISGAGSSLYSEYSVKSNQSVFGYIENGTYKPYQIIEIETHPNNGQIDSQGYYTKYYPQLIIANSEQASRDYTFSELEALPDNMPIDINNVTLNSGEHFGALNQQVTLSGTANIAEGATWGVGTPIHSNYDNFIMLEGSVVNNSGIFMSTAGSRVILEGDATINLGVEGIIGSPVVALQAGTVLTLGSLDYSEPYNKESIFSGEVTHNYFNTQGEAISFASRTNMRFTWNGSNWVYSP